MQELFSKIIEELDELIACNPIDEYEKGKNCAASEAIEIVKQAAEKFGTDINVGSNGWIPVSERLPDEVFGCLVTVMDCEPSTQTDFENILPYFVGYDGHGWNDADGEEIQFEVIAWQPLPQPYTKGE